MTDNDESPLLVRIPGRDEDRSAAKHPRPRCGICGRPTVVATIDRGKTEKKGKRPVGRPRKGARYTRYRKIGRYCAYCEIFYYPNGTPDYRLRG